MRRWPPNILSGKRAILPTAKNSLFVCLQPLVDRRAAGVIKGCVEKEAVVHLRADGDDRSLCGETLAAFGLHIAQDRAPLETVQRLAEHHLHAVRCIDGVQPRARLVIEPAAPHVPAPVDDGHMHLGPRTEQRGYLRGDAPATYHDDFFFQLQHFAETEHIAHGA